MNSVPAERGVNGEDIALDATPDDGDVDLLDRPVLELRRECTVCGVRSGHDHHTRRVAVEAVNNAWALLAADGGPHASASEKRVDKRPGSPSRPRVNGHARLLVENQNRVIFIERIQRDPFRHELRWLNLRDDEAYPFPFTDLMRGPRRRLLDEKVAGSRHFLDERSA